MGQKTKQTEDELNKKKK